MRTRSPAVRLSTSSSLSGAMTSLRPSGRMVTVTGALQRRVFLARGHPHPGPLPGRERERWRRSQDRLLVPVGVAFDGHGDGKARNVAGVREDVDAESGRVAAVALGADPQAVGAVQHLALEGVQRRVRIWRAEL